MKFLKTIGNSIYSPEFYSNVLTKPFKQGIGYFLLLVLLLTLTKTITLINPLFMHLPLQTWVQDLKNCYPKDLEIKITDGQVSTNVLEPYFISSCGTLKDPNFNFLVIDTKTSFSLNKFDEYKAGIWLTKDSIVLRRKYYETRPSRLPYIKTFTLNKPVMDSFYSKIYPYLKFVGPALLLLSFIGIYLVYNFRLIQLLIISALIFLLGKIFKQNLGFGQAYKVGLYAITLGLIVDLTINLTSGLLHLQGFPFMFTILTLAVVLVNLFLPKRD